MATVVVRSAARSMSAALRDNMKRQMSGLASAHVRERMLAKVLSQEYPTSRHCKREHRLRKVRRTDREECQQGVPITLKSC